jgi:hypothetical protein
MHPTVARNWCFPSLCERETDIVCADGQCGGDSAAVGTFWCSVGAKMVVTTIPSIFAVFCSDMRLKQSLYKRKEVDSKVISTK